MGPTLSPETSAFKLQTPGKFPEEYKLHSEHGERLKTLIILRPRQPYFREFTIKPSILPQCFILTTSYRPFNRVKSLAEHRTREEYFFLCVRP